MHNTTYNKTNHDTTPYEECNVNDRDLIDYIHLLNSPYPNDTEPFEEQTQTCSILHNATEPTTTNNCFQFLNFYCPFNNTNVNRQQQGNSSDSYNSKCLDHRCFCFTHNNTGNVTNLQCVCFPTLQEMSSVNETLEDANTTDCSYKSIVRTECENVSSVILNRVYMNPTTVTPVTIWITNTTNVVNASINISTSVSNNNSSSSSSNTSVATTFSNVTNDNRNTTTPNFKNILFYFASTNGTCIVKSTNITFDFESFLNSTYYHRMALQYPGTRTVGFVKPFSDFELCSQIHFIIFPIFIFLFLVYFAYSIGQKIRIDQKNKKREQDTYRVIELKTQNR